MSATRLRTIANRLTAYKKEIEENAKRERIKKEAEDAEVAKAKPDNGINRCYGHNTKLRHASQLDINQPSKKFYDACDTIIRHHPDNRLKGQALKYIRQGGRTEGYERQCARLLLETLEKFKPGKAWHGEYLVKLNLYEVSKFIGA